jgi:hypothetical protein
VTDSTDSALKPYSDHLDPPVGSTWQLKNLITNFFLQKSPKILFSSHTLVLPCSLKKTSEQKFTNSCHYRHRVGPPRHPPTSAVWALLRSPAPLQSPAPLPYPSLRRRCSASVSGAAAPPWSPATLPRPGLRRRCPAPVFGVAAPPQSLAPLLRSGLRR